MQKIAKAMFIMLFLTLGAFAWGQSIFWQDTFDANNGWVLQPNWTIATGELKLSWSPSATNYDMSATSPNITVPAAAGDLVISQYIDEYTGQSTPPEYFEIAVVVNATPTVLWTYNTDADWGVTGGQDLTLSLAPYAGQTIQLRFRSAGGTTFNFDYWHVFGITAYASLNQDMGAVSLTGPAGPSQGTASSYVVTVRNTGSTAAAAYTVKLMKDATTELGTQNGTNLAPNATQEFTFSWTPAATGASVLTGQVVLTGDQNPNNDITAPLAVDVQAPGSILVLVGNGVLTQRMPFGIYYGYERDATLFTQAQLNQYGPILSFKWYCATGAAAIAPYKIYVKTTTETTLTAATWDTFVADATQVKEGTQAFDTPGWYTFALATPYMYTSGNLIVAIETFYGEAGVTPYPLFNYTTSDAGQHMYWADDDTPPVVNGTLNTNKPNIGILFSGAGMSHLTGTVTVGGTPLEGATVSIGTTTLTATTSATGAYDFPFVVPGTYTVTATKIGYSSVSQQVTLVANQTATQNFVLVALPIVNVTGTVFGSDAPTVGLADAAITLVGAVTYNGTSSATGTFSIPVLASTTYACTITKAGYQNYTANITVGTTNYAMTNVVMNEIALPATGVVAAENTAQTIVNVTWNAPGTGGGEWIEWDSGENDNSLGWTAGGTMEVASRWAATDLTDYVGMSLFSVKFYAGTGGPFRVRVYTGGSATAPGQMVVDQAVAQVTTDDWNTVALATPVPIAAGQELWFGISATHAAQQYPCGMDAGPAHNGFGNMILNGAAWTTLYAMSADYDVDWNLAGFVGYSAPTRFAQLQAIPYDNSRNPVGTLSASGISHKTTATVDNSVYNTRSLQGYKVWRLLEGQETNEAAWTVLTNNVISATAYSDQGWNNVADGMYKWAVKAMYSNSVASNPSFSNVIHKFTQIGTISGFVRKTDNTPISGATVTAGTFTATSNGTGAYTMQVGAGTYTVTAAKTGFTTGTQNGIVVVTGQTSTVNFSLATATVVDDGFETYTDFAIDFSPWVNVDVDQSATYGINGVTWENAYAAQAFQIFNPALTVPACTETTGAPHGGAKMAVCWAATMPASQGTGPNVDWLISPVFSVGSGASVSFWARSLTDEYGLERFKVGFSTGAVTPASFTFLSGATYVQAPVEWTLYTYEIPAATTGNIRIGINCLSNDAFLFEVDDFQMNLGTVVANSDNNTPVVATSLSGCYPNPFNPNTTISYSVKGTTPVSVEIYNSKGQKVRTLVSETKAQGNYKVEWNGKDDNGTKVTSGVYFYKMNAGKFSSSKKMILMK